MSCFVDASAIVAILTDEPERIELEQILERLKGGYISPLSIYEAALAVARKNDLTVEDARRQISRFSSQSNIEITEIGEAVSTLALDAFHHFGKGRHKAGLNMGDCFSYACAKALKVPLLCKGDDFIHTDIRIA